MTCELCKKIWNTKKEYIKQFQNKWDENIAIVKDNDDEIGLYVPCEDWYYSDVVMNINYCPICGRKL
jgi:hypothetical protein|uniref:Rad50 zinc hook motif n=1 Tax=virus sp. ctmTa7 TaxID=2828255 RepID=A0A8S5RC22_9VIRU|nr:MAG TPA: Rad50 zinc hook motif [virus sp. ctmTa7]